MRCQRSSGGAEECSGFEKHFFILSLGIRIRDDTGAGKVMSDTLGRIDGGSADGNAQIKIAIPAKPANGAAICAARKRFWFGDEFHRANLPARR